MNFKKILQTIVLAPTLLLPTYTLVRADGFDQDYKLSEKVETKVENKTEQKPEQKSIFDLEIRAAGRTEPSRDGFEESGRFLIKLDTWRLEADVIANQQNFKYNTGDVKVISERASLGAAKYLFASKELELYAGINVSGELNQISGDNFNVDTNRIIGGAKLGIASQKDGYKLLVSGNAGKGKYSADANGANLDGDYQTLEAKVQGELRVFSDDKKQSGEGTFDFTEPQTYTTQVLLQARASAAQEKYKDVQTTNTFGVGASIALRYDARENGKGWIVQPSLSFDYERAKGDSGTSTTMYTGRLGVEAQLNDRFSFGFRAGGQSYDDNGDRNVKPTLDGYITIKF